MTTLTEPPARAGLRERKKAMTRDALIDAALRLFAERGFDATTTEEVAASVNVSQRTFFRYFAGKEDVVLAVDAETAETMHAKLAGRPAEEHPFTALRGAFLETWGEMDEPALHRHSVAGRLIGSCPQLLAAHLRQVNEHQDRAAEAIARRTGVDPRIDPRPRLVAAAFASMARLAHSMWCETGCGDVSDLLRIFERCFDHLGATITEPWRDLEAMV
ncbi:TetR family transcriptional regulator [Marinactinospora thermotolerans]|uniref:Transcriptional regulator, TetR family n=1 Tax=Marinactinospora thermotolerans DSM 45154 TaxID=1122192 RepID=A0A1T4RMF6_9ACTN|nr:TetR family transcriptional regulator [Marinactinospora thermotolerans]SKA17152.1 transcriptional regulator, TetR family [Marinactinospora thermotolerans DSM 45154]